MFFYSLLVSLEVCISLQQLQLDISILMAWSKQWQLNFNVSSWLNVIYYILAYTTHITMVITILMDQSYYQVTLGIIIDIISLNSMNSL